MSMLAEPRRKVRYNLNPNGNTWANDSGTFGKKMLERMGWSSGKGLGANLDGMTSHIKVSYKSDQQGVGFKDRNDQWTAHEDNFSELLKNLQSDGHQPVDIESVNESDNSTETTRKSLELKSKSSRARVHYKKFTRGKDLSRYSSKDLANIFGRRTLEKPAVDNEEKHKEEEKSSEESNDSTTAQKSFGVETLQGGSMADYFKKKMNQFKFPFANGYKSKSEDQNDDEDDLDARPSFGFGFSSNNNVNDDKDEAEPQTNGFGFVASSQTDEKKEKKRKRKNSEDDNASKKKTQKYDGESNQGFDISYENDNIVEDNSQEVKIKPKKSKKNKEEAAGEENVDVEVKKIKKKKKKSDVGLENPNFNESIENDAKPSSNEAEVNPYEVVVEPKLKKKKKKRSLVEEGLENPNFNESLNETIDNLETPVNPYEVVVKDKKKKKKKDKSIDEGIENPVFDDIPKKKKKKSKPEEESFTIEEIEEQPSPIKKKKKKEVVSIESSPAKHKKRKSLSPQGQSTDVEVPCDNQINQSLDVVVSSTPSNNFGITDDLILNISSTDPKPILQTPKSAQNRPKRRKSVRIDESLNQERIIPNVLIQKQLALQGKNIFDNDAFDLMSQDEGFYEKSLELDNKGGITNPGFRNVQEEVEAAQKSLDTYQAEVENDINDIKVQQLDENVNKYIGTSSGLTKNTVLPNGNVMLAFKDSNLSQTYYYDSKLSNTAKMAYRQMVKGDVEVEFNGTNLHEIHGYATKKTLKKSKPQENEVNQVTQVSIPMPKTHVTDMNMVEKLTHRSKGKKKFKRKGGKGNSL